MGEDLAYELKDALNRIERALGMAKAIKAIAKVNSDAGFADLIEHVIDLIIKELEE